MHRNKLAIIAIYFLTNVAIIANNWPIALPMETTLLIPATPYVRDTTPPKLHLETLPTIRHFKPAIDPRHGFARQIAHARRIIASPAERAGRPHLLTIAQAVLKSAGAA